MNLFYEIVNNDKFNKHIEDGSYLFFQFLLLFGFG